MQHKFKSYLSLGSNLEDKVQNLQSAVMVIDQQIGKVTNCSSIYQTPAWGFTGEDFYNICIEVHTELSAIELLEKAQSIEKTLGRKKKQQLGYENRCIDIDIILYENQKIETERLTVPHPRALERNFVLHPLVEILDDFIFPGTSYNIKDCKKNCTDNSSIKKSNKTISLE